MASKFGTKGLIVAEHGVSIRSFNAYQGLEDRVSPSAPTEAIGYFGLDRHET